VAATDRNEVDAALEVIGLIDLKGKIVTGDALHCNRRMVEAIVEKGGDYCIALKGNQQSLLSDARACLAKANEPKAKKQHPVAKTEASGHGRVETRVGVVVEAKGLAEYQEFPGLKAFGRIEATRVIDGRAETDVRIFVLSRKLSPQALLETATCSLADRERAALAARRLVRRGRRAQPQGQRPSKHRSHPSPRARRRPPPSEQGIAHWQAETRGMERRVHAKAAESNAIALPSSGSHRGPASRGAHQSSPSHGHGKHRDRAPGTRPRRWQCRRRANVL